MPITAHLINGIENVRRMTLRMVDCQLIAVKDEYVDKTRIYKSVRSFDVALASAMDSTVVPLDACESD
jgi:hypothetical protein